MAAKPLLTAGVALAGAAAIVAATPAIMPTAADKSYITTASTPTELAPKQLTVPDYQLMAVTLPGLLHAFFNGYGGLVSGDGSGDCGLRTASCVTGPLGALYYLGEETVLAGVAVDNHLFEFGPFGAAEHLAETAGLSDDIVEFVAAPWAKTRATVVDVVNGLTGGTATEYSLPALLVHEFLHNGGPLAIAQIAVELIKEIFDPTPPPATEEPDPEAPEAPEEPAEPEDPGAGAQGGDGSSLGGLVQRGPAAPTATKVSLPADDVDTDAAESTALAGAIKSVKPAPAPAADEADPGQADQAAEAEVDATAALGDSEVEAKTNAELRREAAKNRAEERRAAAKERAQDRRAAAKERINNVRDKVKDTIKRATGGGNKGDDNKGSKDNDG